jgi:hypothetical protein
MRPHCSLDLLDNTRLQWHSSGRVGISATENKPKLERKQRRAVACEEGVFL